MKRKSPKNNNKALQGIFGLVILVGAVLGLTAFILHFTNKKDCSEGYPSLSENQISGNNSNAACVQGRCDPGQCDCGNLFKDCHDCPCDEVCPSPGGGSMCCPEGQTCAQKAGGPKCAPEENYVPTEGDECWPGGTITGPMCDFGFNQCCNGCTPDVTTDGAVGWCNYPK